MQPGQARSFIESARRAQIIEAAIETIAEVGYAKTSFTLIAAKARISPALISYHFKRKRDLIDQIVREVEEDMERALEGRAEGAENHLEVLRALIEGYVEYCARHPTRLIAVGRIEENDGSGEQAREKGIGEFEELLREGQREGEFRDFPTRPMAVTLLAALEAVPTELATHPDTDVGAYMRELATTFTLAVQRHPTDRPRRKA